MKKIAIFGGTGGLGSPLTKLLSQNFQVIPLGSKDVNVLNNSEVEAFFNKNDIDIVLNFSGLNYDSFIHKYGDNNREKIDDLLNTNIKGTLNILSACLPKMRAKNYGRIILISSILAAKPVISTGVYAGCKGFLDSLAKTVALENAGKGVTCNSLQLGYFDGGLTYKIPENFRELLINEIPLKRLGKIEELKDLIEMLIKVEYITGTNLKINGGVDF
jgi:3-oxoacyl-[acyl-carrier protein] reductase